MKDLKDIIIEKLRINQDTKVLNYHTCQPKDRNELYNIIKERLDKDKDANLNDIDVSKITNMHSLFFELNPHDIKIDKWDVSNVEDMAFMFYRCSKFKGKCLENWNVSNVIDMHSMFYECENFNCDLRDWDVSKLKEMQFMFHDCQNFEGKGLENWDIPNAENMKKMFYNCINLHVDLNNWNINKNTTIDNMFDGCTLMQKNNLIPKWSKMTYR